MGEQEWLEQGHGAGEGLQPVVKGLTGTAGERVSIRSVLRGTDSVASRHRPRRRTKALVGWLLYCCTAVGGTAAAFSVRETLFPSLGAPTERSLWVTSKPVETSATEPDSASTERVGTSVTETAVDASAVTTPQLLIEVDTVPSASLPGRSPNDSVDNHGSDEGQSPETGTTEAVSPSGRSGPGITSIPSDIATSDDADTTASKPRSGSGSTSDGTATSGGTATSVASASTVTTVGHRPTDTSTSSTVSTPPARADTSTSTPESVTTDTSGGGSGGKGRGGEETP